MSGKREDCCRICGEIDNPTFCDICQSDGCKSCIDMCIMCGYDLCKRCANYTFGGCYCTDCFYKNENTE